MKELSMSTKNTTGITVPDRKTGGKKPFPQWPQFGKNEEDALLRVLHSGIWGIGGSETANFEKTFAAYQQCRHCVSMANGSVTLRNALLACGLEAGSEVIVPPYTFLATATAVIEANCVPVFADIDPDTYCISPEQIEARITPRTKAVIPVHLGGQAADMDKIMEIAQEYKLYVIEDCAHAHGAEYKGKRVGSIGDIGSFSFQSSKNLCSGEGGAIVTNNDALADRCWSIHNCGRVRTGAWYQHENLGGNYRLSQFQAAILNEQLKKLDKEIGKREENAARLDEKLSRIPGIRPLLRKKESTRMAYHIYIFRYDAKVFGVPRQVFLGALKAEGIPVSEGYSTLIYEQPFMRKKNFGSFSGNGQSPDYSRVKCPVAEKAAHEEGCWLPHPVLLGTGADMDEIADTVSMIYENRKELTQAERL